MSWETVIGLEIHVQLATRSKLLCPCATRFGDPPNTHVCPVCLGLPGTLPSPNDAAVRLAVRAALALGCRVHERSAFARKHYFYPDLPKGYQISQFAHPLASGGGLALDPSPVGGRTIRIARLHLEEDAGKSLHDRVPAMTALDFNRCGVPLIEIVTAPDLRTPAEARAFLGALKRVLQYIEVSDCNMEEGSLRVDANLSVRRPGEPLGTKQEIKNMNSFAAVERSLDTLGERQRTTREAGQPVTAATYTAATGDLRPLRVKEESPDYRYLPDPDLPPLALGRLAIRVEDERARLPELPGARRARLCGAYGLAPADAEVLTATRELADYYEAVVARGAEPRLAAAWVTETVLADVRRHGGVFRVAPGRLAQLLDLVARGVVSRRAAKTVFGEIAARDADPGETARRLSLVQVGDEEQLAAWVDDVLARHPHEVGRYRDGEHRLVDFFMGRIMRASRGRANPETARRLLDDRLR